MFFFVDEAGNSGNNLFDANQPVLSYGVLSSHLNVDVLGEPEHQSILRLLRNDSIHANELGMGGLCAISPQLIALQEGFRFKFDYYFIHKQSYAVVMLFDAIFDAGLNDAVKWEWYWTPLRFAVVAAINEIADVEILKQAWALKLLPLNRLAQAESRIVELVSKLLCRLESVEMDARLREIVGDGLLFAKCNPLSLDFGTHNQKLISPNAVGFQFVIASIARRQKAAKRKALGITVDRQSEFNPAQIETFINQSKISSSLRKDPSAKKMWLSHPLHGGARRDAASLITHFPQNRLLVKSSEGSIGLQLVDVYLWLTNRIWKQNDVPHELSPIAESIVQTGSLDGISMSAMIGRFEEFESQLPSADSVPSHIKRASEQSVGAHRAKVRDMKLK